MSFSAFAKDYAIVVNGKSYDVSFLENQTALDFTGKFKDKETSLSKFGGFEYYTNSNLVIDKNAKQTSTYETGKIYFNLDYNAISFVYANHNLGSARAILIGEFKDKSILKVLEKGSNKLNVRFTDKVSAGAKKSLVVYYSCTGTTHELAQRIAAETGSDIFRLELKNPYSLNMSKCGQEAKADEEKGVYRELKAVPDLSKYDLIFAGTPVWSDAVARPVKGFLSSNNFSVKTVVPFITTWSSGMEETMAEIADLTKGAEHLEGIYQLHGQKADVKAWVKKVIK